MTQEEQRKKMSQLIAKAWADEGFKQKLLADPAATLKAEGAELPAGLSIKALEDTDKLVHLIIPARPTELSDEDLDKVAGGGFPGDAWSPPRPNPGAAWDAFFRAGLKKLPTDPTLTIAVPAKGK